MDVSDENIKREAMKIVWMYSGTPTQIYLYVSETK